MNWSELKIKMEKDYAEGNFAMQSYSISDAGGSRNISYNNFDEWKKHYDFVCMKASEESGTYSYKGRMRGGTRGGC